MRSAAGARLPKHAHDAETVLDDMREPRRIGVPQFILRFLDAIENQPAPESLLAQFIRLDEVANRIQRRHVFFAKCGIFAGTIGLGLSIFQLSFRAWTEKRNPTFFWVEVVLVVVSLVFVLPQLVWGGRWLLPRYRAEQLRLSKWRLFIEPGLATGDARSLTSRIQSTVLDNDVHETAELKGRSRHEAPVSLPHHPPSADGLRGLLDYYVENRLAAQMRYFHRKSEQEEGWLTNPALTPVFFVAALFFVVLHLSAEWFGVRDGKPVPSIQDFGFGCAFAAALIPALLAGIRTWRSALEVTRNATRAGAKETALAGYRSRLQDPDIGASEAFGVLACCEGLFAQEQGEWLRLMLEAESVM
ncbi:MAG TPA: hypothetical protein VKG23_12045 [Thermoanaerobaculia bacterium]|nr:hypothetical protein [Thermoanaerobaculia bacterium]